MELTEQDKQRIENFITKLGWDEKGTAEFNDMMKVAEYATKYEREQQAKELGEATENVPYGSPEHLRYVIRKLKVERTELRNKVIEEAVEKVFIEIPAGCDENDPEFSAVHLKDLLNSLKL